MNSRFHFEPRQVCRVLIAMTVKMSFRTNVLLKNETEFSLFCHSAMDIHFLLIKNANNVQIFLRTTKIFSRITVWRPLLERHTILFSNTPEST